MDTTHGSIQSRGRLDRSDFSVSWKDTLDVPPTPLATPTPMPSMPGASNGTERSVEEIILSYDWPAATALSTFQCENGYNSYGYWRPDVISVTGDYGITQINAATWDWWLNQQGFNFWEEWMLPEKNIAMAYAIYKESGGFWPWNCY